MGFRDSLKKLAQGSERRDSGTAHDGGRSPEPASKRPSSSSASSSQPPPGIPTFSLSDDTSTKPFITGMRIPARTTVDSGAARTRPRQLSDATGKRRPQDTAALVAARPRARSVQTPTRKGGQGEPSPSDYLYFGPKDENEDVARPKVVGPTSTGAATNRNRSHEAPSSSGGNHVAQTSRADDSGFLNTRVAGARQQMGYQHLTYGGSLQYDYSGTQAPF
ncbi:hypothetical protein PG999_006620 [Apiospora kogelbergensis]|uniref:Uncharacterized protein n=1 Tax=Apiospora kogelbergensis TaxID=1337665 RepID=A0AAW0QW08_9PEZI